MYLSDSVAAIWTWSWQSDAVLLSIFPTRLFFYRYFRFAHTPILEMIDKYGMFSFVKPKYYFFVCVARGPRENDKKWQ